MESVTSSSKALSSTPVWTTSQPIFSNLF